MCFCAWNDYGPWALLSVVQLEPQLLWLNLRLCVGGQVLFPPFRLFSPHAKITESGCIVSKLNHISNTTLYLFSSWIKWWGPFCDCHGSPVKIGHVGGEKITKMEQVPTQITQHWTVFMYLQLLWLSSAKSPKELCPQANENPSWKPKSSLFTH